MLEKTYHFLRIAEGQQSPKVQVMLNDKVPFEDQIMTHVLSVEAREAVFRQVSIETEKMQKKSKVCQADEKMGQLTIDIGAERRVPMELESPANKVQKVGMPSTSGEPSQINVAKTIDLTQVSSDEEMEDDTGFQAAVAVKQEITDDYGDDNIFRGLTNRESDENGDIPPHFTPPKSSDSDREDSVLDEDIIELEHIFDQQRDRHRVQVKSEPIPKIR